MTIDNILIHGTMSQINHTCKQRPMKTTDSELVQDLIQQFILHVPGFNLVQWCLHNAMIFLDETLFGSQTLSQFLALLRSGGMINCWEIDIAPGDNGKNVISHKPQSFFGVFPNALSGALSMEVMVPWLHHITSQPQFSSSYPFVLSLDISPGVNLLELTDFFKQHFYNISSKLRISSTDKDYQHFFQDFQLQTNIAYQFNRIKSQKLQVSSSYFKLNQLRRPGQFYRVLQRYNSSDLLKVVKASAKDWGFSFLEPTFPWPLRLSNQEVRQLCWFSQKANRSMMFKLDFVSPMSTLIQSCLLGMQQAYEQQDALLPAQRRLSSQLSKSIDQLPWQQRNVMSNPVELLFSTRTNQTTLITDQVVPYSSRSICVLFGSSGLLLPLLAMSSVWLRHRPVQCRTEPCRSVAVGSGILGVHALLLVASVVSCTTSYAMLNYSVQGFVCSVVTLGLMNMACVFSHAFLRLCSKGVFSSSRPGGEYLILGLLFSLLGVCQSSLMINSLSYFDARFIHVLSVIGLSCATPWLPAILCHVGAKRSSATSSLSGLDNPVVPLRLLPTQGVFKPKNNAGINDSCELELMPYGLSDTRNITNPTKRNSTMT